MNSHTILNEFADASHRRFFNLSEASVEIFNDNEVFFKDFLEEIERAQKEICISNFLVVNHDISDQIFTLLKKKANEGVRVYLLLDGIGSFYAIEEGREEELRESGVCITYFHPASNVFKLNIRNHTRIFVIDKNVAYFGGIAFHKRWADNSVADYMVKVTGESSIQMYMSFAHMWNQYGTPALAEVTSTSSNTKAVTPFSFFSTTFEMQKPLEEVFYNALSHAQKNIFIVSPYVILPGNIRRLLEEKAAEGVSIKIVTNDTKSVDHTVVVRMARVAYLTLLKKRCEDL